MKWVYRARILVSANVAELGKGALDPAIITYCREHNLMWVTKDWDAGTVDAHVRQLKDEGVSAWWLRPEKRKNLRRPDMLYTAARDIELVFFALETETLPIFVTASVGSRARHIQLPYVHRRHGPSLKALPKPPRRPARMKGGIYLFPDK